MKLSSDTISVLKNFSEINQNILFKPGKNVQTISTMKNILAEAEVSEQFDSEFAIYDLPEFIRSVELLESPELKFNGSGYVNLSNKSQNLKYFFSDKSVIVSPTKSIKLPDEYVSFVLTKDNFSKFMKGVTALNLPDIAVKGDGKKIKIIANDKKNKTSNTYSVDIGETDKEFTAFFKTENFKQIPDDYDVVISKAKISHFVNRNKNVKYWIALEPDSEF